MIVMDATNGNWILLQTVIGFDLGQEAKQSRVQ